MALLRRNTMVFFCRCFLLLLIATILNACSFPGNQTTAGQKTPTYKLEPIIQLGHSDAISNAFFVPNSGYVASASLDGSIKIWESASGREVKTLKESKIRKKVWSSSTREHEPNIPDRLNAFAVSPDGRYLVSGGIFGHITIWIKGRS
jgi:WD40 repeat protein